jgi:hypothetical protein
MINITTNPSQSGEDASYSFASNTINMGTLLSDNDNWAPNTVLQDMAHELYHAFQDFSGLQQGVGNEPDAYIFESLFDRQYGMSSQWYNMVIPQNPSTPAQTNFQNSWNSFFNNGPSGGGYQGIYQNFLDGSSEQGQYQNKNGVPYTGPINPNSGGYLIFQFFQ